MKSTPGMGGGAKFGEGAKARQKLRRVNAVLRLPWEKGWGKGGTVARISICRIETEYTEISLTALKPKEEEKITRIRGVSQRTGAQQIWKMERRCRCHACVIGHM